MYGSSMDPRAFHLRRVLQPAEKTADRQGEPDSDGLRELESVLSRLVLLSLAYQKGHQDMRNPHWRLKQLTSRHKGTRVQAQAIARFSASQNA